MNAVSELPPPAAIPSTVRAWRRYPAYRDSGIPWLGNVPEHWQIKPLKHLASFVGGGTPSRDEPTYWNGSIPWVSPKDMKSEVIRDTEDHITVGAISASATSLVPRGTVLLVVRSGILRHSVPVAVAGRDVTLNQDMKGIRTRPAVDPEYLASLIRGHQGTLLVEWRKAGATVESLEHDLIANTTVPVPPTDEQRAIVSFLARETEKVDTLVAKRQRQIALLAEKRAALISRAVTRGPDPNVPMKDSGVPWLGEIPAHWQVKRLKHLTDDITVGIVVTPAKYYVDDGVPCLRSLNVRPGRLDAYELVYITSESNALLAKSMLREGDLVCVRTGQPGTTAVVDERFDGGNCIDLIIIRQTRLFDSHFLAHILNSDLAAAQFKQGSDGAIQQHFNIETAKNLLVPVLPIDEQRRLVAALRVRTADIDALTSKLREHVTRLREFRTALIAAAVTGQIDVRGAVR